MRLRLIVVAAALLGVLGSASTGSTLLVDDDTDGCQAFMPYSWTELAPGGSWTAVVDLRECASADIGWFRYYGFISGNKHFDGLRVGDGIVLSAEDMSTRAVYTFSATAPKTQIMIMVPASQPTQFRLTAVNTSKKTKNVRMTWRAVN
jgi:hypothetical protein